MVLSVVIKQIFTLVLLAKEMLFVWSKHTNLFFFYRLFQLKSEKKENLRVTWTTKLQKASYPAPSLQCSSRTLRTAG